MIIRKAFRYRLKPNKDQEQALAIQFGHARFVYNWALARRKDHYKETGKGLNGFALNKELTTSKRDPDFAWLKQADAQVLQQKTKDLDRAYTNFFEGRAKYPNFKRKDGKQSICYPQRFKLDGQMVYLPKVGWVKAIIHRPIEGEMKNTTVTKTKSGRYFISIQCELEMDEPIYQGKSIGIDLGLIDFATLSTGEKIANLRWFRKAEARLVKAQKSLSRKKKGSMNWQKQRVKVARLHEKIVNQRADFQHKLSRQLIETYGLIRFENLNIKGMVKNHSLAKSIADAGWSQFVRFVEYKGEWYGTYVEKIDRFFASSKICSDCRAKNALLKISDREWACSECGVLHDRDVNAAINILNWNTVGTTEIDACGQNVRQLSVLNDDCSLDEARSPTPSGLGCSLYRWR